MSDSQRAEPVKLARRPAGGVKRRARRRCLLFLAHPAVGAAFLPAMQKPGAMNPADVRPNKPAEIFLFSHPPIWKRIRLARTLDLGPDA